jgi:hypothetical protein
MMRLVLEIAAIVVFAFWGWFLSVGPAATALALLVPMIGAGLWGTFAVPDDPSRSGNAPIAVPGIVRLLLELSLFAAAVLMLFDLGAPYWGKVMAAAVAVHYLLSYDRVAWLIRQR